MTRKDYEVIARVLRAYEPEGGSLDPIHARTCRNLLVLAFADELAQTNPRFDRARFLKACGVDS